MSEMKLNKEDTLAKTVFGRFIQQKLRGSDVEEWRHREVKDVIEEMKDAVLLVDLMEVMSGKKMQGKRIKNEKFRIKMITNANEAMKFVESCGVDIKTIRISAEDIVDGKVKVVLAMVFQIIVKYMKFDEDGDGEAVDLREGLCLWLNNKIDGYDKVDKVTLVRKKIPTKKFHNGLIFLTLVHKMRPKLVDYEALSADNGPANLDMALDLGEKYLNIEKYISAADICIMDELSIIVYLSDWFTGVILLQKQDIAARRVGKLVDLTILHDRLRTEYTDSAAGVRDWVVAKKEQLAQREFDDTLAGVKKLLADFYTYKGGEKGEAVGKQLDAAGLFTNLQARLANHKRPAWKAPEGTGPEELDKLFEELAEVEIKRSVDLNAELARQVHLHKLYARFQANAEKLTAWMDGKRDYVGAREAIDSVEAGEDALETLEMHNKAQEHVSGDRSQLSDLVGKAEELGRERFEHAAQAAATSEQLQAAFAQLAESCKEKGAHLATELQRNKDLNDQLCKAFADAATGFEQWLKAKRDALGSGSEATLQEQLDVVKRDVSDTKEADDMLADVAAKDEAVAARNIGLNPHSNLTSGDMRASWSQFQLLLQKKVALLEEQIEEASRGGLTQEQRKEIDDNFNYFDKDKSGFLNKKELRVCLSSLGEESRPQDVAALLEEYDTDKNGTIKLEEFVEFMKKNLGDSNTEPEMHLAFKLLCYDKDHILPHELTNVVNDKSFKDHHVEYLQKEAKPKGEGLDFATWTSEAFAR